MSYKQIKTDDADLTRVQGNVAAAFAELPAAAAPTFVTTSAAQYRVVGNETCVFVDAHANTVTVVLAAVTKGAEAPIVKRIDSSKQAVTVQAIDNSLIDGAKTLSVDPLQAVTLMFDGSAWWSV